MGKQQKSFILYQTDGIVQKIARALRDDLGLGHQYSGEPRSWTMQYTPLNGDAFKKHYQMAELLKKYTFQKDVYTSAEVLAMSKEKFFANQRRLAAFKLNLDPLVREIMFRAKGWIDHLLGDYDLDEHLRHCYWPKKASVGVPQRKATLENRWLMEITGSKPHLDWFDHIYLPWFGHAEEIRNKLDLVCVEHLSAILVNKTYKSKRMIVPNTSVGGLYTNGLGAVIVNRLAGAGYDVKVLPDVHKRLARQASKDGLSATIDQTMASDNILVQAIELVFPMRWAKALLFGRIDLLAVDDEIITTPTLSTMGIGYTFPVQMVLFLGLTHAVLDFWEEIRGSVQNPRISCFGDDLICPVEILPTLRHVFESLGLLINEEKSFWKGPFRESCGGDYYRGFDVRPAFIPEGGELGAKGYESWLYRTHNALKRRWEEYDIDSTLQIIYDELLTLRRKPFVVPSSYGDDAGLKLPLDTAAKLGLREPRRDLHGTYTFDRLVKETSSAKVNHHEFYMWEHFRVAELQPPGIRVSNQPDRSIWRALIRLAEPHRGLSVAESIGRDNRVLAEPAFHMVIPDGSDAVLLKRTKVDKNGNQVPRHDPEACFMGPPKYASRQDKTRTEVKVVTAVRLDDGVARYAVKRSTSFTWL